MVQTRSGRVEVPSSNALGNMQQSPVTKPTLSTSMDWGRLPSLVQEAVLKELAHDYNRHSLQDRRRRASYAAVSLQWQEFFEKLNFDKLVLSQPALEDFRKIVHRRSPIIQSLKRLRTRTNASPPLSRMPRIRHIWLRVELLPYDCKRCKLPEEAKEVVRNNVIFTKAIWTLLSTLSDLEKFDSDQVLTLEFSAHSPSDQYHCFQDDAGLQTDYPHVDPISVQRDYIKQYEQDITSGARQLDDEFHGFSAGQYSSTLAEASSRDEDIPERLIRPLEFDSFGLPTNKHKLPEVKIISSFIVRRQFYRELCPRTLSRLLREAFTSLRNIRYERWRLPDPLYQKSYELSFGPTETTFGPGDLYFSGKGVVLGNSLPSSLELMSLFEERSEKSPDTTDINEAYETDEFRSSGIRVLDGLAGRAANLKHLSVSFLSDAMDCLKFPADAFPNLQSLAITSQEHLQPADRTVGRILLEAATAVTKLPKLQIMELWSCEDGDAAIFRYEARESVRARRACELTWRSSWPVTKATIGADVMKAWEHTAQQASRQLSFTMDPLPDGPYTHYAAILRHLKLRELILDPVSAMQVRVGIDAEGQPEVPVWKASVPYSPVWSASRQD